MGNEYHDTPAKLCIHDSVIEVIGPVHIDNWIKT